MRTSRLLSIGIAFLLPASGFAAGSFDSASGRAARSSRRTLSWEHRLGEGAHRVVVVGVTLEDHHGRKDDPRPAVTFGGVPMLPVPGGVAVSTGRHDRLRTQAFYLLDASLPPAGKHRVTVTLPRTVHGLAGTSLSLFGLAQAPPESVAVGTTAGDAERVSATLTTLSRNSWIVEAVGADDGHRLLPAGGEQSLRVARRARLRVAGSAALAAEPGTRELSWALSHGDGLLAQVAAAFAPLTYALTTVADGNGTVSRDPDATAYDPGTVVTLTATPADGWAFVGWGGDVSGADNPVAVTMDAPKTAVARFLPLVSLSTAVDGRGSITRQPDLPEYVAGTPVELTAVPVQGWRFTSWSGDLTGSDNPATIVLDADKSVTAIFTPDPDNPPEFALEGWATAGAGTTGGEGGPEVAVDTLTALRFYAGQDGPYVIKVFGTIAGNEVVRVRSNKSILGIGGDARLLGVGLQIGWNSEFGQIGNVIIRNLAFEKQRAPIDGVLVAYGAKNVWIDHCDFSSDRLNGVDFYDGLIDVNHGADFITVSWSRFHDHFKTSLVGNSDNNAAEDAGHLTVTYHHNSFINSGGRNPSVRFGLVHVYDNLYRDLDDYGIASRMGAQVVVENNWFENVNRPIRADTSLSPVAGSVGGVESNVFLNSTPNSITGPPITWAPPYAYLLDPVVHVPELVGRWAGVGVVVFEGDPPPPTPPTITSQPVSQTVDVGQNAGFSVTADGSQPLAYQWHKDGTPIDGATGPTLSLPAVQLTDAGSYTVEVSNAAGSVTSDPAVLTVESPPPPPPPSSNPLQEQFADGERNTQALPASAAWFTSSGSNNLLASPGELRQIVSSSRTFLAYFTDDPAAPLTLGPGQTVTLDVTFRFTGFDSGAPVSDATFRIGLLRAVANPAAVSGAGFVANGPPNTNSRVIGDFGSNGPSSGVFFLYTGYAALTSANASGTATPIRFYARTGSNNTLLGSTSPFTQIPVGTPTPSAPMETGVPYRGRLSLQHTAAGISLSYSLTRVSDGTLIMSHSVVDVAAAMTEFDTVAFYVSKASASPTYDLVLTRVDVARTGP